MKIVVLDGYSLNPGDLSWEELAFLGDLTVYDRTAPEETLERCRGAEILITNKTKLTADIIDALPELRYIGLLATGYNVVDVKAAARHGIVVSNIPAYSTQAVAQMVFSLLLAIITRVEYYTELNRQGEWSRSADFCYRKTHLTELCGERMGIVGFGNIGQAVARIALAFGMSVSAYTSKPQSALPDGVEKVALDELFEISDVVSLHCPLNEETEHLVNARRLSMMKSTSIVINTGRGGLVDEHALADALNSGRIAAAGADVLSTEPPSIDNPLLTAKNMMITPHIAWATKEARERAMDIAVENLRAFLDGHPQNNVAGR